MTISGRNAIGGYFLCNCFETLTSKVSFKNQANNGRFRFFDYKLSINQAISKGGFAGEKFPALHPAFIAHPHIFGNGLAFLLGQRREDGGHHLAGDSGGVDVLLLEADAHADFLQLPCGLQTVLGVSCEAGDGLHQNFVDPAPLAVCEESLEVLSLVRRCAGDPPVGVNIHQLPIRVFSYEGGVVSVLCGERVELVRGIRADTAVCRYPETLRA